MSVSQHFVNNSEESGFDSQQGQDLFSFFHGVKIGFRARAVSYPTGTGGSLPGDKAASMWSYTATLPFVFMAWGLIKYSGKSEVVPVRI
jgi:hypothetical protein